MKLLLILLERYKQYIVFAFVGGAGTLIALVLTYTFTEWFGLWYILSYIIATLIAWTFNFYCNSVITFRGHSKDDHFKRYIKFVGMYVVAFAVNATLVYILTDIVGVYYLISIAAVTIVISIFTFMLSKHKIFTFEESA